MCNIKVHKSTKPSLYKAKFVIKVPLTLNYVTLCSRVTLKIKGKKFPIFTFHDIFIKQTLQKLCKFEATSSPKNQCKRYGDNHRIIKYVC